MPITSGAIASVKTAGPYGHLPLAGAYHGLAATGIVGAGIAAAATSAIFALRWASTTKLFVLDSVYLRKFQADGTPFANNGSVQLRFLIATGFTVADSGGTDLTSTWAASKLDSNYAASAVTDVRVSTTAALTAGTRTNGVSIFGYDSRALPAAAAYEFFSRGEYIYNASAATTPDPVALRANEGLIAFASVEATGSWTAALSFKWREYTLI